MVTMGPVGLMRSTGKQKLIAIIGFSFEFFSLLILSKKVSGGWVVGFLNLVSSPGPAFVKVKARLGQVGDWDGHGFVWPSWLPG